MKNRKIIRHRFRPKPIDKLDVLHGRLNNPLVEMGYVFKMWFNYGIKSSEYLETRSSNKFPETVIIGNKTRSKKCKN